MNREKQLLEMIFGALFDFSAYLTVQDKPLTLSSRHDSGAIVDCIRAWAEKRNIRTDDADVLFWQNTLNQIKTDLEDKEKLKKLSNSIPSGECFDNMVLTDSI